MIDFIKSTAIGLALFLAVAAGILILFLLIKYAFWLIIFAIVVAGANIIGSEIRHDQRSYGD